MHTDERRIYIALLTTGCIVILLILIFVITILRYQRRKVTASLLAVSEEMQIQEMERSRIASDLHDNLGSSLSAIKLRLSLLTGGDDKEIKLISDISDSVDSLIDTVRVISNQLLPVVLERHGLRKALEELVSPLVDSGQYRVTCEFVLPPFSLNRVASLQIYRIFQEIINNILKHSGADRVSFYLVMQGQCLHLRAEDNGTGFNLQSPLSYKGLGLQTIRMRADALRAKMYLVTHVGGGVSYHIEIPAHVLTKK